MAYGQRIDPTVIVNFPTEVVTAAKTLESNRIYVVDNSGGIYNLLLPISPNEGDLILLKHDKADRTATDYGLNGNGNTINNVAGITTIDTRYEEAKLEFAGGEWFYSSRESVVVPTDQIDKFTPIGGQTVFSLTSIPINNDSIEFRVNGTEYDIATSWTIAGLTVTWLNEFPLDSGDKVVIEYTI